MTKCWFVYANYKCTTYQEGSCLTFSGFGDYKFAKPMFTKPNVAEIERAFHVNDGGLSCYEADLEKWLREVQEYMIEVEQKLIEKEDDYTKLVNKIQEVIDD